MFDSNSQPLRPLGQMLLNILFLIFATSSAFAMPEANQKLADVIAKYLKVTPSEISDTPIPNIKQASMSGHIVYFTSDGEYYFLDGHLYQTDGQLNLSTLSLLDGLKDHKTAVTFPAEGKERAFIYFFTDIDCFYCVKMHKQMPELNKQGITVHYYGFPRAGIGSPSEQKLINVWCNENPQDAMNRSKAGEQLTDVQCDNPVADHYRLGVKLDIRGTPAMFTATGKSLPGYLPVDSVLKILGLDPI